MQNTHSLTLFRTCAGWQPLIVSHIVVKQFCLHLGVSKICFTLSLVTLTCELALVAFLNSNMGEAFHVELCGCHAIAERRQNYFRNT